MRFASMGRGRISRSGSTEGGVWASANQSTEAGIPHIPNLPTEEVFTSPDWRRAEGAVRSTAPLLAAGTRVDDLELRFEGGKIVEVSASTGADIIRSSSRWTSRRRTLGEVALVDGSSPIKKTGLIFHDTLFDENRPATSRSAAVFRTHYPTPGSSRPKSSSLAA